MSKIERRSPSSSTSSSSSSSSRSKSSSGTTRASSSSVSSFITRRRRLKHKLDEHQLDEEREKQNQNQNQNQNHRQRQRQRGDYVYTVSSGDTLWDLSRKLSVPLDDLLKANGNSSLLSVGDTFLIPVHAQITPRKAKKNLIAYTTTQRKRSSSKNGTSLLLKENTSTSSSGAQASFWNGFRVLHEAEQYRTSDLRMRRLLHAMRCVETSNCPLPAPAGDNGTSIGPLQISHAYHNDAWNLQPNHKGSYDRWMKECQGKSSSQVLK